MLLISAGRGGSVFFENLVMLGGNDMMGVVPLVIQESWVMSAMNDCYEISAWVSLGILELLGLQ